MYVQMKFHTIYVECVHAEVQGTTKVKKGLKDAHRDR